MSFILDPVNFYTSDLGSEASTEDVKKYLVTLGKFLVDWKWLVLTRPTHILVAQILKSQAEIIEPLAALPPEIHQNLPFEYKEDSWPKGLAHFMSVCRENLVFPLKPLVSPDDKSGTTKKKTSSKKLHETSRLSALVASVCAADSIKCIVDVGSGLGYVDRELCQVVDGCRILAIESDEARCASADAANKSRGFADRIIQLPMKLHRSNINEIADTVNSTACGTSCLIALHACGDLTPTSLRLFQSNNSIQSAVIISCCYHKMSVSSEKRKTPFFNFPLSGYVSSSTEIALADVSFLRLAAESTRELWASRSAELHTLHAQSVAFRAVVQLYEEQNGIEFKKTKRKAVKTSSCRHWKSYVEAWVSNTCATRRSDDQLVDRDALQKDLQEFISEGELERVVKGTMAFNTLRNCVQHLVEAFVLADRLLALKEAGFTKSSLIRVSDPAISPRSIAIVVRR